MPARDLPGFRGRILQAVFSPRFEGPAGYLLAVVAVAVVFLVRLALQTALGNAAAFILFIPVILISAIAGGFGPGLVAFALSLAGALYIVGPALAMWVQTRIAIRMVFFSVWLRRHGHLLKTHGRVKWRRPCARFPATA